jgi:predicted GH43/DUF377 family glycosyl hydrolase
VLSRREGAFDEQVMEPGPAPIITTQGILLLYNGANRKLVYGPGWVLFDGDGPFLTPELSWEKWTSPECHLPRRNHGGQERGGMADQ